MGSARQRFVLLTPSRGFSGGIEGYVSALSEHLYDLGMIVDEVPVRSGERRLERVAPTRKLTYFIEVVRHLWRPGPLPRILVMHSSLLPVAILARFLCRADSSITCFFHGEEVWSAGRLSKWMWARAAHLRVAVSTFTAGALASCGPVAVMPPGIPSEKYEELVRVASGRAYGTDGEKLNVLSVFRLDSAMKKGAYEFLDALRAVREETGTRIDCVLAGVGPPPAVLAQMSKAEGFELRVDPTDDELMELYAWADVFVLATRFNNVRGRASGEGFGIVLAEAALAGCVVVAPYLDGSRDAYVNGVTGLRPLAPSVKALSAVIRYLADHPSVVNMLATNSSAWSARAYEPESYGQVVRAVLLGEASSAPKLRESRIVREG